MGTRRGVLIARCLSRPRQTVTMLGKLGWWRHAVVGTTVAGCGLLAALGVIGSGPQRFDAKQVIVQPAGGDGIQITEIVDIDFGNDNRHGYERLVPNDFGVPTNVSATSSDAPDDVSQESVEGDKTRIRIGRSDTTVLGPAPVRAALHAAERAGHHGPAGARHHRHRREARDRPVRGGRHRLPARHPLCNVGSSGASGGCTLSLVGDVYRVVIAPLKPHRGITIGGTIVAVTEPVDLLVPPLPARRDHATLPLTIGIMALGATGAGGGLRPCSTQGSQPGVRRRGSGRRGVRCPPSARPAAARGDVDQTGGRRSNGRDGHDRVRAATGPGAVAGRGDPERAVRRRRGRGMVLRSGGCRRDHARSGATTTLVHPSGVEARSDRSGHGEDHRHHAERS